MNCDRGLGVCELGARGGELARLTVVAGANDVEAT